MLYRGLSIALAIPCFNEEKAIAKVIQDFRTSMPELAIYVFDNASTDRSASLARASGARVVSVPLPGKGNVVRRMFADVTVMVDGDATYEAAAVRRLIDTLIDQGLDMVVGCRQVSDADAAQAYRPGHRFGNRLLTATVKHIFGGQFRDMLSGCRAIGPSAVAM